MISLKRATEFHGHLGPYLVLGILAGEFALSKLKCKKYFDLKVKAFGANEKPKSCLIDGLQLSSGATYGKGNIKKLNGTLIKMEFTNCEDNKKVILALKNDVIKKLEKAKARDDSELLAKKLYKTSPSDIFNLTTKN